MCFVIVIWRAHIKISMLCDASPKAVGILGVGRGKNTSIYILQRKTEG
jgi:hypothetical protein